MNAKIIRLLSGSALCTMLTIAPAVAHAQDAGADKAAAAEDAASTEIIVTANKRETNLQETALAVSVMGGEDMQTRQITDIEGLAKQLPGVNFGQTTGNARITIRGIGMDFVAAGNEGRVAYHVDGVYLSRPSAALAGFFDIERVEALRGPQGTLYGRNATGGAINVITRKPTAEFGGYLEAGYGNYNAVRLEGAVGGGLAEGVSARVSFQLNERDGYGKNLTTGNDVDDLSTRAMRGQLLLEPTDNFEILLSGDWFRQNDHAFGFHYVGRGSLPDATTTPPLTGSQLLGLRVGGTVPTNLRDSTNERDTVNKRKFWGLAANMNLDLGSVKVSSITGYRDNDFDILSDIDVTSAPINVYNQSEKSQHFSQELRVSGEFGRGDWMIGGYYFEESLFGGVRIALDPVVFAASAPVVPPLSGYRQGYYAFGDQKTEAWAAFANVSIPITDALSVRLGARYSRETRRVDEAMKFDFVTPWTGFVPHFPAGSNRRQASKGWSSFTPSVTIEYKANEDLFLYATYSRGFKSGGFNLGLLQAPYEPERLDNYELGARATWMDGLLTTNVSAFYYDYGNLQVNKINGATAIVENAASSMVKGFEAEILVRPSRSFQIDIGASVLDAEFKDYITSDPARAALGPLNLIGNKLVQAPGYTINAGTSNTWDTDIGEVTLRGEARLVDRVWGSAYNTLNNSQPAYELYNAFLTWRSNGGSLSATAYVRNITDKQVLSGTIVGTGLVGFPLQGTFEPPRTYGVTLGVKF